ncbi:hypothetical protein [Streptomyces sp. NPDC001985]|uniref:hypothetical protein n=1 Tax=Streptomyces sp. NPDC001985 TaxID=3154406 RepID=UPI0033224B0B
MHALELFTAALNGDDGRLRALAGPTGLLCAVPALSSVLLVENTAGETQRATLALAGPNGGGMVRTVPLPRSFPVRALAEEGGEYVLTGPGGRTVRGTPDQFARHVRLIGPEHDPAYESHREEAFLATHLLPVGGRRAPGLDGGGEATVTAAGQELSVGFDSAGPEKAAALMPHLRSLLDSFDGVRRAGTAFLWEWGADGTESAGERARFLAGTVPTSLVLLRSGGFELHYEDLGEDAFPEGHWPAVRFLADRTPVDVVVES